LSTSNKFDLQTLLKAAFGFRSFPSICSGFLLGSSSRGITFGYLADNAEKDIPLAKEEENKNG
jgi:hypothetical protein